MLQLALFLAVLVGVTFGFFGGGGSILTVPILIYLLQLSPNEAIATSLVVVGSTGMMAMIPHARAGRVRWKTGFVFGLAGMAGAFGGGKISKLLPPSVLLLLFGSMMLVTAIAMLRKKPQQGQTSTEEVARELPVLRIAVQGLAVGSLTGLVGAGGGFIVVPALVLLGGLPMAMAVGTSIFVISLQSLGGLLGHLGTTQINWTLAAEIASAAIVGSFLGFALASKASPDKLRRYFAWFVVSMAVFILGQQIPELLGAPKGSLLPYALLGALVTFGFGVLLSIRADNVGTR